MPCEFAHNLLNIPSDGVALDKNLFIQYIIIILTIIKKILFNASKFQSLDAAKK